MNSITDYNIDEIDVGNRIRSHFSEEDLDSLKDSIKQDGLLQPIIINQDNKLIAGHRRYLCCKALGHSTIQARKITTKGELHEAILEIRENMERQEFTFSEKMKAAEVIEPIIKEKSEERLRYKTDSDLTEYGIDITKGKSRDIMAQILKMGSGSTYERSKKVWETKDEKLIKDLDTKKIKIGTAYLKATKKQKEKPDINEHTGNIPRTKETVPEDDNLIMEDESQNIVLTSNELPEGKEKDSAKPYNNFEDPMDKLTSYRVTEILDSIKTSLDSAGLSGCSDDVVKQIKEKINEIIILIKPL